MNRTVFLLTSLLIAGQTQATIITGEFKGVVYESYTQDGGEGVYNGQELTASITYDTEAAQLFDYRSDRDNYGLWADQGYDDSWVEISYTVGGVTYEIEPYEDYFYRVMDNVQVQDQDPGSDIFKVSEYYSNGYNRFNYAYMVFLDHASNLVDNIDPVQYLDWEDLNATSGTCNSYTTPDGICASFYAHDYLTGGGDITTYHKVYATLTSATLSTTSPTNVPEPSTLLLMSLGLGTTALMGRRRRKLSMDAAQH
ncbi:PEP-CTERM sorting domain-containing protein [Pseudomonadota bacterium]